ncbi:MAG TPA: hypothetical protein VEA59_01130 [Patescibacteria group bacterium]|nr:hypothetical protein [Patescibacteria group bacterium]
MSILTAFALLTLGTLLLFASLRMKWDGLKLPAAVGSQLCLSFVIPYFVWQFTDTNPVLEDGAKAMFATFLIMGYVSRFVELPEDQEGKFRGALAAWLVSGGFLVVDAFG